jgi:hypothetical protein
VPSRVASGLAARAAAWLAAALLLAGSPPVDAQARRPQSTAPSRPAPAPARPATAAATTARTEPAMVMCPSVLGEGVETRRVFCDVLIAREPTDGIIVTLPPHTGDVTLTFDVHNRHTYSEELTRTNRAYSRYTATIGVLTMNNDLLTRAIVQNEFRAAGDLVDRVSGGNGPGGVKAVAPTGTESISVTIPAAEQSVSILGEKLSVIRSDRPDRPDNFSASGRPIAVISNVMVQYRPAPPKRAPATRRR